MRGHFSNARFLAAPPVKSCHILVVGQFEANALRVVILSAAKDPYLATKPCWQKRLRFAHSAGAVGGFHGLRSG